MTTADKIKELAFQLEIQAHEGRATSSILAQLLTAIAEMDTCNKALVEALEYVIRGVPKTWEGVQKARAAIAKATGVEE